MFIKNGSFIKLNHIISYVPPIITQQPVGNFLRLGDNYQFYIKLEGSKPLLYQWYRNNFPLSGETTSSLFINNFSLSDVGDYYCKAGNKRYLINSDIVSLRQADIPYILNFNSSFNPNGEIYISTFAGSASQKGIVDGIGLNARFNSLKYITIDSNDNLYVTDTFTVRKITPAGHVSTIAGSGQGHVDALSTNARFSVPMGIVSDSNDNLFIADKYSIRKISTDGYVSTFAGSPAIEGQVDGLSSDARFGATSNKILRGITIDSFDNLYVIDEGGVSIRKITSNGLVSTLAGSSNTLNGYVDGLSSNARFSGSPQGGLVSDTFNNLFLADVSNYTVRKITSGGEVTTFAGLGTQKGDVDETGSNARFDNLYGIAKDSLNNLYVSENSLHKIRKITPDGTVTSIAGKTSEPGSDDGVGPNSTFCNPRGLVVDSSNNLYICDSNNYTIRKGVLDESVALTINVSGTPPFNYQWYKNNTTITGSTSSLFIPSKIQNSGDYFVVISNIVDSVTSNIITI
jgi:hypothetical protein